MSGAARPLLAALLALFCGTAALADLSATRPEPRPDDLVSRSVPAPAGLPPVLAEVATAADAGPRPRRRPGNATAPVIVAAVPGNAAVLPKRRPAAARRPAVVVQVAAATRNIGLVASVRPPERPENLRRLSQVRAVAYRTQPAPVTTTGRKGAICGDPSIKGTRIPPIAARITGCGLDDGVKVTLVDGVALSTPATIDCKTAKALKSWVADGLKPAVGKLGGGVVQLQVASSYACRPRNNQKGEKISEHGRGRAIDISGFTLKNGTTLTVLKGWGNAQQGKILRTAHRAACRRFGTVLGPNANSFHRDHFHFDTARYRSGHYCR
jgi:hypothetical protein